MIVVLATAVIRDGLMDEALAHSREHVLRSRAEPGCIAHDVHRHALDTDRLVFVERWASREALWTHFEVPASRAYGKALAGFAAQPPTIEVFDVTDVESEQLDSIVLSASR